MKKWWRNFRRKLLPWPIYGLVRLIGMSLRLQVEGFERYRDLPRGRIYAGWHGRTFIAATFFRNRGVLTIISNSNDGDMQNRIFQRFGFRTIRGSTGRGGVRAAVESIKALREGAEMAFTPDGPRGPSGVVQGGIMMMAQKAGALLVPVGVSASRRWLVRSWDRFMVPKPFSRAIMIFGEPIELSEDADEATVEAVRLQFESELHRLEKEAEQRMGHAPALETAKI